ncbi:MAG: PAS domain S-box protein, partial [Verrucomicrobia bacterium]|nr:PAS domain S-box protein [Verrucomicrobiota bacterium]
AEHKVVSGMTVAIGGRSRPFGVLGVHATSQRTFGADDIHFLRTISNLLATAIRGYEADQAQRDGAARVRAIVNTLVDGIITIDERGRVESINPSAEKIFGYASEEIIGRNVNVLMPEPYHEEHDQYLQNYLQTGKKRIIGIGREVSGLRKDGTIFPMDLAVGELQISGKRMFTGVVRDITDRRRMEREILESGADEQRRIGQDLHDGLCQHLAGIAFATEVVSQKLTARAAPEASSIGKIGEMIDQAITQARDLARGLQPVTLDANGLVDALKALADRVEQMFHVSCLVVFEGACLVYDNNIATHLYRIAQESISNAIKHGKAHTLVIELAIAGEDLSLTIKDDGVGLRNTLADAMGMGLRSMDYRARLIGGTLRILPGDRGGTTIICSVRNKEIYGKERKKLGNGKEKSSNAKRKEKNPRRR